MTVALVVLTLAMAATTLIGTASSATTARLRAQQEAELLRVASIMRRQIICIARSSATQTPVVGEIGREPHSDWLDMVTSSLLFSRGIGRAEWRIIRSPNEAPYLAYRETPWVGGENLHNHPWIPFSRMITGMLVRYWSVNNYVDGWHLEEVPERIQVILDYTDANEPTEVMVSAMPGIGGVGGAASLTNPNSPPSLSSPPAATSSTSPSGPPSPAQGGSPGTLSTPVTTGTPSP